jgi:hypothetical protein
MCVAFLVNATVTLLLELVAGLSLYSDPARRRLSLRVKAGVRRFSFSGDRPMHTEDPIQTILLPTDREAALFEVPDPVLLNTWKHHAGALRHRIRLTAHGGQAGLIELAGQLVVLGTELMDLYVGRLAPAEIAERVLAGLRAEDRLPLDHFRSWVAAGGGYQVLTFPEDASRWVLRMGEEDARYVHVHPARWAPATLRVRANVLKSAVMVLAHVAVHGGNPLDVALVNWVRDQYLALSPVKGLTGEQGLRGIIDTLRATP